MNLVSRVALAAALTLGGLSLAVSTPAVAQKKKAASISLSKEERAALVPLQTAVNAKDSAAVNAALPAARAAARGADARYAFGNLLFQHGRDTNNKQMQAEGVGAMIDSGAAPEDNLLPLYQAQASMALEARDNARAEAALSKLMQLTPNDPQVVIALAQLRAGQKRAPEAATLLDRAIALKKASGQPVDESWYKFALKNAYDAKLGPESFKISRDWLTAYPNPKNWRDAILIYRELAGEDRALQIDAMRLQRVTKSLSGERDYYDFAEALSRSGYPGEVKAVLDEGVAGKMIDGTRPMFAQLRTSAGGKIAEDKASLAASEKKALAAPAGTQALKVADAYFGYGEYAKAVPLYKAALQKGSVDANVVNTRLGLALGLAGQKAEAEAALKTITGPRAELANYMLIWLSTRA